MCEQAASSSSNARKHVLAVGPDADPGHRDSGDVLDGLDVLPGLFWKLRHLLALADVLLPARHRDILDLNRTQLFQAGGHLRLWQPLAVELVAHADLNLTQACEHVKFGDVDRVVAVERGGVLHDLHVEPAAPARPPGRSAVLVADIAQPLARLVIELSRERPSADARRVRLHNADHAADLPRRHAEARAHAAHRRARRRHERERAKVDVKQRGVRPLHEHARALFQLVVHKGERVHDLRRENARVLQVPIDLLLLIDLAESSRIMPLLEQIKVAHLVRQRLCVEQVDEPQAVAVDLRCIARADPTLGRTNRTGRRRRFFLLEQAIDGAVGVEQDLCPIGDEEAGQSVWVVILELLDLAHERGDVHDNTVADDILCALVDHAAG
mmetsp:Transcript_10491/g.27222  ORF Transcript_10491/g.27222 Transcript_10491/m.27222 type:complete len:384 (-) Transcript_10491:312-1463(-)